MIGEVFHESHAELAARLTAAGQMVDALVTDCPYSARVHTGHDDGAVDANRGADYRSRVLRPTGGTGPRRAIDYPPWSPDDVASFVATWSPLTRGWFVSITDHVLAPAWESALEAAGRYVFAPLPLYSPGSRVRLSGDGPSSWTCWIVVARPKTREYFQWGTLPGGYECAPERMDVVGGKPLAAMRAIVRDYSRPNEIVCDPCTGASTTLLAAKLEGRRYIGSDINAEHVRISRERLRDLPAADRKGTLALFGGGT